MSAAAALCASSPVSASPVASVFQRFVQRRFVYGVRFVRSVCFAHGGFIGFAPGHTRGVRFIRVRDSACLRGVIFARGALGGDIAAQFGDARVARGHFAFQREYLLLQRFDIRRAAFNKLEILAQAVGLGGQRRDLLVGRVQLRPERPRARLRRRF